MRPRSSGLMSIRSHLVTGVKWILPLMLLVLSACGGDESIDSALASDGAMKATASTSVTVVPATDPSSTTTSIAKASTTTVVGAPDADSLLVFYRGVPGDSFTVDLSASGLAPGTPLFVIGAGPGLPAWAWVGDVPDDGIASSVELQLPTLVAWRLEHGDFGAADLERVTAGRYLLTTHNEPPLGAVELTRDADPTGFTEDIEETRDAIDEAMAILRSDGLADTAFGTPTDQAIAALIGRFGIPLDDIVVDGCPTFRVLRWASGIHARFDDTFAEYSFYAWDAPADPFAAPGEHEWPPPFIERESFTTPEGFTIGSSLDDLFPWVGYSGGYDDAFGATIWFESDRLGGMLSADVSDPSTIVITVEAGRNWNPARIVC